MRLACVGVARDDGGDAAGRGGFAGRDENEQLHEVVINVEAARLQDEHVFVADGLCDFDVDLAVGKVLDHAWYERNVQSGGSLARLLVKCLNLLTALRQPGPAQDDCFQSVS